MLTMSTTFTVMHSMWTGVLSDNQSLTNKRKISSMQEDFELLRFVVWIQTMSPYINWDQLLAQSPVIASHSRQEPTSRQSGGPRRRKRRRLFETTTSTLSTATLSSPPENTEVLIPDYSYNLGNCPNAGSQGVPCAPANLSHICDKYQRDPPQSSLRACILACIPSYCCIHTAPKTTNPFSPTCHDDENCAQYAPCYIAWWKISDRVGPAYFIHLQQTDDFFNVANLTEVTTNNAFYQQVLFHHFQDIQPILQLIGTSASIQDVFANPGIWGSNSSISGNPPPPPPTTT